MGTRAFVLIPLFIVTRIYLENVRLWPLERANHLPV